MYSWTARVSIVRWNLKEAVGKSLVRRTEIAYEARLREISWRKTAKSNNYHICRSRVNAADLWGERACNLSVEISQRFHLPSNNELWEVSRTHSSEEVSVMEMERRGEQSISSSRKRCQTIKLSLEKIKVYARGWLNYYGIASMKNNIDDINGWLYHRIRMCIWKQWKKPRTKARNLIKMGVPEDLAMQAGNTRRGHWFATHTVAINMAMTKEKLINSGFYDLAIAYQSVHVNYWKRRIPNGTYGAVRGRRLVTASYSIKK